MSQSPGPFSAPTASGWRLAAWAHQSLASLKLAVGLMVMLSVVCVVATAYEARYGTVAVQRDIYRAPWFAGVLGLLGVNILLSMTKRYPWRAHHVGFVLAHFGILGVLTGSLVSLHLGLGGNLVLAVGESSDRVALMQQSLQLTVAGRQPQVFQVEFDQRAPGPKRPFRVAAGGDELSVIADDYAPHAAVNERYLPSTEGPPAIHYLIEDAIGRHEGWLPIVAGGAARIEMEEFSLSVQAGPSDQASARSEVALLITPDGPPSYEITLADGTARRGLVVPGLAMETPWARLTVNQVLRHSTHEVTVEPSSAQGFGDDWQPAVKIRLQTPTITTAAAWIPWDGEHEFRSEGLDARVRFGPAEVSLPFRLTLLESIVEKYPGSEIAASYESRVRLDDLDRGSSDYLVSMNRPLRNRGYVFFQSSVDRDLARAVTFSVIAAPGLPLVYAGTALVALGVIWMFSVTPFLARRRLDRKTAPQSIPVDHRGWRILLLSALSIAAAPAFADASSMDALRKMAIQDGGRVKPLDTFAREAARRVLGEGRFGGGPSDSGDSVEWLLSIMRDPEHWRRRAVVAVADLGLRQHVGLARDRDHYSYEELTMHAGFAAAGRAVDLKLRRDSKAKLDRTEREVVALDGTLRLLAGILDLSALRVVPNPVEPRGEWRSLRDLDRLDSAAFLPLIQLRDELLLAVRDGRNSESIASALAAGLIQIAPADNYPSDRQLLLEVHYNAIQPFRLAGQLAAGAFVGLAFGLARRHRRIASAGLVLALGSFTAHSYGIVLRVLIAGRPPVTDMYESVIWVTWGSMFVGLIFEAIYRSRLFAACASAVVMISLTVLGQGSILDGAIQPLVPVLRDNLWLATHVLTIGLGYSGLLLAMVMAHVYLAIWYVSPTSVRVLSSVSILVYRSLQVGVALGVAGAILGGWWASYAWGRFWGWDAKETSIFIALMSYLGLLHARRAGLLGDFGTALAAMLGFLTVVWSWYGVNFLLKIGLHSYGFDDGGGVFVAGFAVFEILAAGVVLRRYRLIRVGSPSSSPSGARATRISAPSNPARTSV